MPESHAYVAGWYSGSAKAESLAVVPGSDISLQISARSRGLAPNYGDGPWFCAVKDADSIRLTDGVVETKPIYYGVTGQREQVGQSAFGINPSTLSQGAWKGEYQSYVIIAAFQTRLGDFVTDEQGCLFIEQYSRYRQLHIYHPDLVKVPRPGEDNAAWISASEQILGAVPWERQLIRVTYPDGRWGAGVKTIIGVENVKFNFKNNELDTFQWATEFSILANGSASRFAAAFSDAVDKLDLSQVNSLANIIEGAGALVSFASTVRHIFKGDWGRIISDLKSSSDPRNLWLSYRYVYTTTKLDIGEYRLMLQRLGDLANVGSYLRSDGRYVDETGSYGCRLKVKTDDIIPKNTVEFLAAVGIEPNAQNLWDMIPYSFIVDWFLHISDLLEAVDKWGNAIRLPYTECWMTYKSEYDGQTVTYRIPGRRPDITPIYKIKEASSKTIKMRIADSISLFTH